MGFYCRNPFYFDRIDNKLIDLAASTNDLNLCAQAALERGYHYVFFKQGERCASGPKVQSLTSMIPDVGEVTTDVEWAKIGEGPDPGCDMNLRLYKIRSK